MENGRSDVVDERKRNPEVVYEKQEWTFVLLNPWISNDKKNVSKLQKSTHAKIAVETFSFMCENN